MVVDDVIVLVAVIIVAVVVAVVTVVVESVDATAEEGSAFVKANYKGMPTVTSRQTITVKSSINKSTTDILCFRICSLCLLYQIIVLRFIK